MTTETSTPETVNPCKRELTIEVPSEVVNEERDKIVARYSKLARIDGFRKGKVPASVVRQRFADDIKSDLVEALVPRFFREEAQKRNLVPVSQPRVTDLHLHDGEPLRFKAEFEIFRSFKLLTTTTSGPRQLTPRLRKRTWSGRSPTCACSTPRSTPSKRTALLLMATLLW